MASPTSTHSARAAELDRLVRAQARDDAGRVCYGTHECDLAGADDPGRPVLDQFSDPRQAEPWVILARREEAELAALLEPDPEIRDAARRRAGNALGIRLLGLGTIWSSAEVHYPGKGPCPCCGSEPPPAGSACLICSATHREPVRHAMQGPAPRPVPVRKAATRSKGKATRMNRKVAAPPAGLAGGIGPVARPLAV